VKLVFDQNLSHKLVRLLANEYPGSIHARNVGLGRAKDQEIWHHAKQDGFIVVSKDDDFAQLSFLHGHPPKVIWLRLGNCPTEEVEELLRSRLDDLIQFAADPNESIFVLG